MNVLDILRGLSNEVVGGGKQIANGANKIIHAPYNQFADLAQRTSGAHPIYGGQFDWPLLPHLKPMPFTQYARPITAQEPQGYIPPSFYQPANQTHPNIQLISAAYGGMQPFHSPQADDEYTAGQALQPVNYNNGQATSNGQLTQGPMSGLYRLLGK